MLARAALFGLAVSTLSGCALLDHGGSTATSPASNSSAMGNALSARIHGTGQTQAALVKALFDSYGHELDAVIDNQWTPAFTDSLLAKPAVREVLAKAKARSKSKSGKAPATAADVIPQARLQIEERRAALHAPLEALEAALLARVDSQTRAMDSMNAVLATGGKGALPGDVSQAAMPAPATLSQTLEQAEAAVHALRDAAAKEPKLLNAWPKLTASYTSKLAALTASLGS